MSVISMKSLLESGVHFGHRTHKWHPAMKPYIFTERNGIHIIDLQKTAKAIDQAYNLVRDTASGGGTVLFVGTKRQAQDTIRDEATRCSMPFVTNRWLGGMLTNWRTMRQRINELDRLERMREKGEFSLITKKEALILERKIDRLESLLGGIRKMATLPEMLFVVDVHRESTAIHEANLLEIPIVALVDTNCDPGSIDHVIPSNDDAIRAIKLLVGKIADAVMEGRALRKEEELEVAPEGMPMAIAEELELSDEELLGEATLAKLPPRGRADEEGVEQLEALVEESGELVSVQAEAEGVIEDIEPEEEEESGELVSVEGEAEEIIEDSEPEVEVESGELASLEEEEEIEDSEPEEEEESGELASLEEEENIEDSEPEEVDEEDFEDIESGEEDEEEDIEDIEPGEEEEDFEELDDDDVSLEEPDESENEDGDED